MGPNLGKNLYPLGVLRHYSLVPDFSKSGTGTGESPRFRTNRGRGRGSVPVPGQIGDGRPVPVPGQIGDGDGDGDRGVRALTLTVSSPGRLLPLGGHGSCAHFRHVADGRPRPS
jgi:hypothetical protein